ncbi:MAG TPA: TonB-dependent receptor [Bryobacteraceae bacterium]|nr:TonB-dependent receptor [Bryobacteraceae bacterium]
MKIANPRRLLLSAFVFVIILFPLAGQSPNTGSLTVLVADQSDAIVRDAEVSVVNSGTGAVREAATGSDGSVTIPALPLIGSYTVRVSKTGFGDEQIKDIVLRSGETATVKVKLLVGSSTADVTVYGTTEGVRADPEIGLSFESKQIDETPVLGRKLSSISLLNSAFRQAKGTGDLFVNQTYVATGAGSRRTATTMVDGANNDEAWGRQIAMSTLPMSAVQEMTVLTTAFSSEYGWTSGPALNIVTKSGTNAFHGEGIYLGRPGDMQAKSFSTKNYCAPSVPTCTVPSTLTSISPVDVPDTLNQISGSFGGPILKDKTFFFVADDYTRQNRTALLSNTLPAFVLPANGDLSYTGEYHQELFDGRVDHRLTAAQNLAIRLNVDRFFDTNPQDAVGGTSAPSVARVYARRSWTAQISHSAVLSSSLSNEARFTWLNGDPVTEWDAQTLSTTYTRTGSVPFTIGQSRVANLFGHQGEFSDTLSWARSRHYVRFGVSAMHHTSGGTGSEPGTAALGTFTFKSTTTAPLDQLTLNDVQQYTQPISFGVSSYVLKQWLYSFFVQDSVRVSRDLTLDLGMRYDRQTLTNSTKDFAPRVGFGWHPGGSSRLSIRGGYGMYYSQIQSNLVAGYLVNGLDGLATYTATPGQLGFPTCLTGSCLPLSFDPKTLPASELPARDITIGPGMRSFYEAQFARYGLNFDLLPNYPDKLVNPRSQVVSIGGEREIVKGFFAGADYVHQHWTDLDRTVDLNAPAPFDRTAAGQVRTVAAANATRPILPVNGGVRQVNVLMNLGVADYDGLQTQFSYRSNRHMYAAVSYTLSKATNTTEPDGNGIGPNDSNIARLGDVERGPSVLDQRHRAVITYYYNLPLGITLGTVTQIASARPFNATTGVDNNGDGINNDRPVINGQVVAKSAFRGTGTSDVAVYLEERIKTGERAAIVLRIEGFNLFNHGNFLGRGQTTYGDTGTPNPTFGQLAAVGTASNAVPAFANVDPPRMFQLQVRFVF